MMGDSPYLRDNSAFVGHSPQAIYEQLWFQDRERRLRIRILIAIVALVVGARFVSTEVGLLLALLTAGGDTIYHWRQHAATAVWRRGQRGDRRMAKVLRWTVEPRGYRVLHYRTVPGHGAVDQLVVTPTGVWLIHNVAWSPDTEISARAGKLFIGKSTARTAGARRDQANTVAELLSRELGTRISATPLLVAHGGSLPRRPLAVDGMVVLRPYRVPVKVARYWHAYGSRPQIDAIAEAAVRVLPIGGRLFPPRR